MPFNPGRSRFRVCPKCKTRRVIDAFNKAGSGLRHSHCHECSREASTKRDMDGLKASTRHNIRRRYLVLQHYSGKEIPQCECCGEKTYEFLSLDHVGGGGAKHRKQIGSSRIYAWVWRNSLPAGFRVLCHNCNQAIGAYGFCPHKHPDRSLRQPPTSLREKQQKAADEKLISKAKELAAKHVPITAARLAKALRIGLPAVEHRIARLRKQKLWPFPRVRKNLDKF